MDIRDEEVRYTFWDNEAVQIQKAQQAYAAANPYLEHPLYSVFMAALAQVLDGKGMERHGSTARDFYSQPWAMHARLHGRGFLTGQAAKKLGEAASGKTGDAFEREVLGAIVYAAMAILKERGAV